MTGSEMLCSCVRATYDLDPEAPKGSLERAWKECERRKKAGAEGKKRSLSGREADPTEHHKPCTEAHRLVSIRSLCRFHRVCTV